MLCYVADDNHMYQFRNNAWNIWIVEGTGGGTATIQIVSTLADLENPDLKIEGSLVFV